MSSSFLVLQKIYEFVARDPGLASRLDESLWQRMQNPQYTELLQRLTADASAPSSSQTTGAASGGASVITDGADEAAVSALLLKFLDIVGNADVESTAAERVLSPATESSASCSSAVGSSSSVTVSPTVDGESSRKKIRLVAAKRARSPTALPTPEQSEIDVVTRAANHRQPNEGLPLSPDVVASSLQWHLRHRLQRDMRLEQRGRNYALDIFRDKLSQR